jgi:hypothetical protein
MPKSGIQLQSISSNHGFEVDPWPAQIAAERARSTPRAASEIQRGKRVLQRAVIPAKMPASMRMHINQTRIISTRPLL